MEQKISLPQWEKDWNLQPMNLHGLMDEYLEMGEQIEGGISFLKKLELCCMLKDLLDFQCLTIEIPVQFYSLALPPSSLLPSHWHLSWHCSTIS